MGATIGWRLARPLIIPKSWLRRGLRRETRTRSRAQTTAGALLKRKTSAGWLGTGPKAGRLLSLPVSIVFSCVLAESSPQLVGNCTCQVTRQPLGLWETSTGPAITSCTPPSQFSALRQRGKPASCGRDFTTRFWWGSLERKVQVRFAPATVGPGHTARPTRNIPPRRNPQKQRRPRAELPVFRRPAPSPDPIASRARTPMIAHS